ncbi:methionine ABC transporter ATP-binding protein [Aquicella lusitana]|uniref:Cell division ATP-binding protein FtsE n=1 Tax=Aquicella lusitana TaxID=254246 RepID=A0A370GQQ6_9COXI|nr:methionine ABC transporter ATP-binding protein [Aquicella lusitana]RDI44824.1 D-methionine transport system ATP-binding protein [Aquicella lusitana]VVC73021.1 Methionine import ATP-binding protein MetN [Aquicella lusitana]
MIELKEICKIYTLKNRTYHALREINLTIQRGEIFGIFGESGAGKSTLLRTVNLLERPTSGQIFIDQTDLTTLSPVQLKKARQQMGMIFQHFNLLESRTAYENIALPLELLGTSKEQIQQKVSTLLDLVQLGTYSHHYPSQLSGGQKQRVAIARALTTRPHILLCDEPTSALDPKSTLSVLTLLKEINQKLGVTILLITHEMDVIKHICHRAAVLDQGRLVECGSVIELFARPKSEITRQLVQKALHIELPNVIKQRLQVEPDPAKSPLVRFTFVGDDSSQPFITTLVQKFNITINIIQANIENIQDATVGFTVCQLSGNHDAINQALAHINSTSVSAEVLGYA